MKTRFNPVSYKRTVEFTKVIRYNLEVAAMDTVIALTGERQFYPTLTANMRVLGLINRRLSVLSTNASTLTPSAPISGSAIITALLGVGKGARALSEAFEVWSAQSRTKLLQGWVPHDVAADATQVILTQVEPGLLSQRDIYDFVMYAVPGLGTRLTEREAVTICYQIARFAYEFALDPASDPMATTARLCLINLLAYVRHAMRETSGTRQELAGKTESALAERIKTLKQLAGYTLGIQVSAFNQVTRHLLRWLSDDWVRAITVAESSLSLSNISRVYEERAPSDGPYTALSSLAQADVYDSEMIQLPGIEREIKPATLNLPTAPSPYQEPLAVDLQYPLALDTRALAGWVHQAWTLISHAQVAQTLFQSIGVDSLNTITVPDHKPELRGDAGIAGVDTLPGYPVVATTDPTAYWGTSAWAIRLVNDEPLNMKTRAAIVRAMVVYPLIPVRISGTAAAGNTLGRPIQPTFRDVDHSEVQFPRELATIARLWDMTEERLKRTIMQLPVNHYDQSWRSIAQNLAYIGIIYLNGQRVEPFSKHWYHSNAFDPLCFDDPAAWVTLADLKPDKRIEGGQEVTIGGLEVVLRTFKYLPRSSRMSEAPSKMAQIMTEQEHLGLPLLQWISTEPSGPTNIEIQGWALGEGVIDIVSIPSQPGANPFFLTSLSDVGPLHGRQFNAVVETIEPVAPAAPPVIPPPPGMMTELGS